MEATYETPQWWVVTVVDQDSDDTSSTNSWSRLVLALNAEEAQELVKKIEVAEYIKENGEYIENEDWDGDDEDEPEFLPVSWDLICSDNSSTDDGYQITDIQLLGELMQYYFNFTEQK